MSPAASAGLMRESSFMTEHKLDPNWRDTAIVLSVGPSLQEVLNWGSPDMYAGTAGRHPQIIYMVINPGDSQGLRDKNNPLDERRS